MLKVTSIDNFFSPKVKRIEELEGIIKELKFQNLKIGLCHGGFDLVHPGHIKHIESAKKKCDKLIVSTTSDQHISKRKGSGRPIYPEKLRAYALASIEFVDYVTIIETNTGLEAITSIQPNIYFKGPDFLNNPTPELLEEKRLIEKLGGQLILTTEPNLSTTEIIRYIKNELDIKQVLLCIDRDGTLIKDKKFLGRNENWKSEIEFNKELLPFLRYIDNKAKTTKLVISNQAGVASDFFDETRVEEINKYLNEQLKLEKVNIDNWQYCPYVDKNYVIKHPEIKFNQKYIQEKTKRKPSIEMVIEGLEQTNKVLGEFHRIIVIGDTSYDEELARNLKAKYIDINNKDYESLRKEVDWI